MTAETRHDSALPRLGRVLTDAERRFTTYGEPSLASPQRRATAVEFKPVSSQICSSPGLTGTDFCLHAL
jgi:hypothetical protein